MDNNDEVDYGSMGIHANCMFGDVVVTGEAAPFSSMTSEPSAMFSLVRASLQTWSFLSTSKFFLPILRQLWRFSIRIVSLLAVALDRADETPGAASIGRPSS